MIRTLIKFLTTKLFFGRFFDWLKNNLTLFFLPIIIIFLAFYIPFEYENYLEFKQKFPEDSIGVYINLLRPIIIIFTVFVVLLIIHLKNKKIQQEQIEKLKKLEKEKLDKIAREKESLQKLQELRDNAIIKTAESVTTKETFGAAAGGIAGGVVGSSIGIAGFGTAIAGTLPVAAVGAVIGYLGMKLWKNRNNKKK